MADHSNELHNGVSAEELSHKWSISLENTKATLDAMMQMNVRLAIFPLTKIYWTGLLSQKVRRLSVNFYAYTLLYDDTSVRGNKYA